jgi:hypothetical protein
MNAGERRDEMASLMNFGCVLQQIRWIDRKWFPVSVGGSWRLKSVDYGRISKVASPDHGRIACDITAPAGVLCTDALRRCVHGCHEVPYGLDSVVVKSYLAAADEMRHRSNDLLIVLGHFAHGLDDIKERQVMRFRHGRGLLYKGSWL